MLTESLFLHVFAGNTVFAVTSGVDFWNIQVETELQPKLYKYCFFNSEKYCFYKFWDPAKMRINKHFKKVIFSVRCSRGWCFFTSSLILGYIGGPKFVEKKNHEESLSLPWPNGVGLRSLALPWIICPSFLRDLRITELAGSSHIRPWPPQACTSPKQGPSGHWHDGGWHPKDIHPKKNRKFLNFIF